MCNLPVPKGLKPFLSTTALLQKLPKKLPNTAANSSRVETRSFLPTRTPPPGKNRSALAIPTASFSAYIMTS